MDVQFLEGIARGLAGHDVRVEEADYPAHILATARYTPDGFQITLRRGLNDLHTFLHELAHIKLGHVRANLPEVVQGISTAQMVDFYNRTGPGRDPYPTARAKEHETEADEWADKTLRALHSEYGAGLIESIAFGSSESIKAAGNAYRERLHRRANPTVPILRNPVKSTWREDLAQKHCPKCGRAALQIKSLDIRTGCECGACGRMVVPLGYKTAQEVALAVR